eukprot:1705932-Prorocentrum_lima.AAC.1
MAQTLVPKISTDVLGNSVRRTPGFAHRTSEPRRVVNYFRPRTRVAKSPGQRRYAWMYESIVQLLDV